METIKNSPTNEFEDRKYIIVKTPHNSFSGNYFESFIADQKYQQAFHIFLYVVIFLMGVIVGNIFHDRFLNSHPSQLVWKSSNLMQPDSK